METEGQLWIIYDTQNKRQSKPLNLLKAQKFIISLKSEDYSRYLVWTPGWEKWITVQNFLSSPQSYFTVPPKEGLPEEAKKSSHDKQARQKREPVEEDTVTQTMTRTVYTDFDKSVDAQQNGYWAKDFSIQDVNMNQKKVQLQDLAHSERRKKPRHDLRIEVILFTEKKSFKTTSTNISITGILLNEEMPKDMLNHPLQVILINKLDPNPSTNKLFFDGKIAGDILNPRRVSFLNMTDEMVKKLDSLFESYKEFVAKRKAVS
jgi:hypothetical protein